MSFATKSIDQGSNYKFRSDYSVTGYEYYGYAEPGSATSVARWKVYRGTLDADGKTTAIDFMNASNRMDQIWDDHISKNGVATSYS